MNRSDFPHIPSDAGGDDGPPETLQPDLFGVTARRTAARVAWWGRPDELVAADLARLDDVLLRRASWRWAKTMPWNPHAYSLKRTWHWRGGQTDFEWVCTVIRTAGRREPWPPRAAQPRWYDTLRRDVPTPDGPVSAIYWLVGYINFPDGRPSHKLINRKPVLVPGTHNPTDYVPIPPRRPR